jgi:butyrate kinase
MVCIEEVSVSYKILAINPGSTSTKIALYEEDRKVFEVSIEHTAKELEGFEDTLDQFEFRYHIVASTLEEKRVDLNSLSAVVGRGGLLPHMSSGGYLVTEDMLDAFWEGWASPHASNLGALLANKVSEPLGIPAYIYDSVTSDEFDEIAKVTGMPEVRRESMCHVLNMKAVSRKVAKKYGKKYEELNLIVAHMGGGISIGVHHGGKIVDGIRDDAGPFSPERAGSIPLLYVIDMCYSGKYNKKEMVKRIRGSGGIKAYLGTSDCREVEKMIEEGNEEAKMIYEAQAYQIAKGIGEMAPVLNGRFDFIILTGGMAHSKQMTDMVRKRVEFIAPVEVVAGEDEMEALSLGTLRILKGEETAKRYKLPEKGGRNRR